MSKIIYYINSPVVTISAMLFFLLLAGILALTGNTNVSVLIIKFTLLVFSLPLLYRIGNDIFHGKFGVDLIAGVAIISSFIFGQYLPGVIIALMLSGGQALEAYAFTKARKELSALLARAPQIAHLIKGNLISDVQVNDVVSGDLVLIKVGEIFPIDGVVIIGTTVVDESTMTGESVPITKCPGSMVISGTINEGDVVHVRALKPASESKYEQIIKLVKNAESEKAPFVRLADKTSIIFTVFTFILAGITWFITKDPSRLVAILVIATPCPLILATPIAFISGMSRAAGRGIIIKRGAAIEALAKAKAFIFDKTGTITIGVPELTGIIAYGEIKESEVLRISASLDQLSNHILAHALIAFAQLHLKSPLSYPEKFKEYFGDGVVGTIDNISYYFGKLSFLQSNGVIVSEEIIKKHTEEKNSGVIEVYLGMEKQLIGAVTFSDQIRKEARFLFEGLRTDGISKIVLLSGDREHSAKNIANEIGITDVKAECTPEDKVQQLQLLRKTYSPIVMIGDGINDAPALALADVGIAIGGIHESASSDTADIVILAPSIYRIREAYHIARISLRVAKEGIVVGIGLSVLGMIIASLGYLPPIVGAFVQEAIDILVILNALRVATMTKKSLSLMKYKM